MMVCFFLDPFDSEGLSLETGNKRNNRTQPKRRRGPGECTRFVVIGLGELGIRVEEGKDGRANYPER